LLDNETFEGKKCPASTYKGDVDIDVKVVDKQHPVTAGLDDFILRDEIYRGVRSGSDIHVLCTTEGNPLAWTRQEKRSRVFGTIVGHGPAYDDAKFQKLLASGIRWAAGGKQPQSTSKKTP
jgi:type 1 glutamine amidotransferase